MNQQTLYELRTLVARFPYYQNARLLMLHNLYLLHDPSFENELRNAAINITDRRTLFNLVELGVASMAVAEDHISEDIPQETDHRNTSKTVPLTVDLPEEKPLETAEKQPIASSTTNTAAAAPCPSPSVDYMAYLLQTENAAEETNIPQMKGQQLIDDFINSSDSGKITLQDEPEFLPSNESNEDNGEGYFTETLARIYIKQGRYSKALEIIRQLNLNYPKKNRYFADQIRFLEKIIYNNNKK